MKSPTKISAPQFLAAQHRSVALKTISLLTAILISGLTPYSAFAFGPFGKNKKEADTVVEKNKTGDDLAKTKPVEKTDVSKKTETVTKNLAKDSKKVDTKASQKTTPPETTIEKKATKKDIKKTEKIEKAVEKEKKDILKETAKTPVLKQTAKAPSVKKPEGVIYTSEKTTLTLADFLNTPDINLNLKQVGKDKLTLEINKKPVTLTTPLWDDTKKDDFDAQVKTIKSLDKNLNKALKKCDEARFKEAMDELSSIEASLTQGALASGAKHALLWQHVRQSHRLSTTLQKDLLPLKTWAIKAITTPNITLKNAPFMVLLATYQEPVSSDETPENNTLSSEDQYKEALFNQALELTYWQALNDYAQNTRTAVEEKSENLTATCPIANNVKSKQVIAQEKTPLQFVILANDDKAKATLKENLKLEDVCLSATPKGAVSIISVSCELKDALDLETLQKTSAPVGKPGWFDTGLPRNRFKVTYEKEKSDNKSEIKDVASAYQQLHFAPTKAVAEQKENLNPQAHKPVTIALIGSGLDINNPALVGALWVNKREVAGNNVDDDGNGYTDDVMGWNFNNNTNQISNPKGADTLTAQLTAQWRNNETFSGINPEAVIMALPVEDSEGITNSIELAQAIRYAVDNGAKIIQLSNGGQLESWIEPAAVRYATNKGVLIISAAGDDKSPVESIFPTALTGILTVAAVDHENNHLPKSNWGKQVTLAAPNGLIKNQYATLEGSLFAASLTTASASLLIEERPVLSNDDIKQLLVYSAKDIDAPGIDQYTGNGLINLASALKADPDFYLNAEIAGIRPKETESGFVLEVIGTADADQFKQAWLEYRAQDADNEEASWEKAPFNVEQATRNGILGAIPVELVESASAWTLRVMTEHQNGETREGRYILKLQ